VLHSVFKSSQIDILARYVLKSETLLLSLSRKVSVPPSKVKRTTIVPEDILVLSQLVV
jgi:hypothetical protein